MHKTLLSSLSLVYHPISNQEADWLWEDPEVREHVKRSKLYMIAQREEVLFEDLGLDPVSKHFSFSLATSSVRAENLSVDLGAMIKGHADDPCLEFELGPKQFRVWNVVNDERNDLLAWCTVDKLLYHHWRNHLTIQGLSGESAFTTFRLLYVGISKQDDSFSRLFQNGHEKRAKILSNERQIRPAARLTDELFVFLFDVDQFHLRTLETVEDIDKVFESPYVDKLRLVADAEKAFVKILNTHYNTQKYKQYPKSTDGLHGLGFDAYAYFINEGLTFLTSDESIRGAHVSHRTFLKSPDIILVSDDTVTLAKPGEQEG